MPRFMPERVYKSALPDMHCGYCNGTKGHEELIHTGDENSLDGWEWWFCCHACRDKGEPCETFFQITLDMVRG